MKCPKCSYISFDHNELCPKCKRDLTVERQMLNLPSFRPNPPFLLSPLVGETGDPTRAGFRLEGPDSTDSAQQPTLEFNAEDSQAIEAMEEAFGQSQDGEVHTERFPEQESDERSEPALEFSLGLEDLPDEPGEVLARPEDRKVEPELDELDGTAVLSGPFVDGEGPSLDLEDLSQSDITAGKARDSMVKGQETRKVELEELALAVEDLVEEEQDSPLRPEGQSRQGSGGESIDFDDLILDDSALEMEEDLVLGDKEDQTIDLEKMALEVEDLIEEEDGARQAAGKGIQDGEDEEIFVNLDDIKEDETGRVDVAFEDSSDEEETTHSREASR